TFGVMLVRVGPGGLMVKVSALLVPPVVVTVMDFAPRVAVAVMAKVAVICVAVTTGVPVMLRPVLAGMFRVAPARVVPTMVTGTLVPCAPIFGVMLVSTGVVGFTVKVSALLVPPVVVTVMFCAPRVAVAA